MYHVEGAGWSGDPPCGLLLPLTLPVTDPIGENYIKNASWKKIASKQNYCKFIFSDLIWFYFISTSRRQPIFCQDTCQWPPRIGKFSSFSGISFPRLFRWDICPFLRFPCMSLATLASGVWPPRICWLSQDSCCLRHFPPVNTSKVYFYFLHIFRYK